MQQLAAKQSDLAALGISRSEGKMSPLTVGQDDASGPAFSSLYREARQPDSPRPATKQTHDNQTSAARQDQAARQDKSEQAHTAQGKKEAQSTEAATADASPTQPEKGMAESGKTDKTTSVSGDVSSEADERKRASSDQSGDGSGQAELAQPPKYTDEELEKLVSDEQTDIDWLAYVDAVKSASDKLKAGTEPQDPQSEADPATDKHVADLIEASELLSKQASAKDITAVDVPVDLSKGREHTTPVDPVVESVLSSLNQLLNNNVQGQTDASAAAAAGEHAIIDKATLEQALQSLMRKSEPGSDESRLLAQLQQLIRGDNPATKAIPIDSPSAVDGAEVIKNIPGVSADDDGEASVRQLIQNELVALIGQADKNQGKDVTDKSRQADALLSAATASDSSENAEQSSLLMLTKELATLSEASVNDVTEKLSSSVNALLASSSTEVQQSVKSSLSAGLSEMQQQLSKGHEPGIDLKAMIQQALNEAGMSQTQSQTVMSQLEQQASQLQQMVSASQQSLQQILNSHVASADTVIQENNQVRTEAGRTLHQADQADKPVNIHRPEGQQQLQEKIRWMVNSRVSLAEIRLDPPELGSMHVRVNMNGDAASVSFVVQSQQARDALNDAMPRLREMFAEQGIELGESFVSQEQGDQGDTQEHAGSGSGHGNMTGEDSEEMQVTEHRLTRNELGGIDYYA